MNDKAIKIAEEILQRTTNCKHDFSCLSGDKQCLCKVTGLIGFDMKNIKPKSEMNCSYRLTYGDKSLCVCPTRNEIYNRYRI